MTPAPASSARVRVYRLSSDCPDCGRPLVLSRRRSDAPLILRCSGFRCAFEEDYAGALRAVAYEQPGIPLQQRREAAGESVVSRLRDLIFRWHPDRHPSPVPSVDVTAELTALLDAIRETA